MALFACQKPASRIINEPGSGQRPDAAVDAVDDDESASARKGTIAVPYEPSAWIPGKITRARFGVTKVQTRHDGPFGQSRIEMEYTDGSGRRPLVLDQFGRWRVLGYLPDRQSYIVAGAWEQGAFEPYGAMAYLDERTGVMERWQDERSWYAFAAVPSPDMRFVALVGSLDAGYRVLLWNTVADRLFDVAEAPDPPPLRPAFKCRDYRRPDDFGWGSGIDAVVDLDPGIITFTGTHLVVSYGRDTCRARAKRRTRKMWPLEEFYASP